MRGFEGCMLYEVAGGGGGRLKSEGGRRRGGGGGGADEEPVGEDWRVVQGRAVSRGASRSTPVRKEEGCRCVSVRACDRRTPRERGDMRTVCGVCVYMAF